MLRYIVNKNDAISMMLSAKFCTIAMPYTNKVLKSESTEFVS